VLETKINHQSFKKDSGGCPRLFSPLQQKFFTHTTLTDNTSKLRAKLSASRFCIDYITQAPESIPSTIKFRLRRCLTTTLSAVAKNKTTESTIRMLYFPDNFRTGRILTAEQPCKLYA